MQGTIIEWDGNNVPLEMHRLPPGRYVLAPLEEASDLTPGEDTAIRQGLDDLAAGRIVPFEEVVKEFETHLPHA